MLLLMSGSQRKGKPSREDNQTDRPLVLGLVPTVYGWLPVIGLAGVS